MTDLDYDDLPATPPQSRWKRFLKGLGWVCLGLTGAAVYFLFEDLRAAFHIGIGIMIAGLVLRDLFQSWMREVIRQETKNERERLYSISQRLISVQRQVNDLHRLINR